MLSRILLTTSLLLYMVQGLSAQDFQFGLNFLLSQPQDEFQENVEGLGGGVGGIFAYRPGNSPFLLGTELDYIIYGHETRDEPFSKTIPDVTVEVTTSNNILIWNFLLRLQGNQGRFRPYIDGLIGMHYFFTKTEVSDDDDFDDEPIATSTNQDDAAFSYGAGGGVMLMLHTIDHEDDSGSRKMIDILLDFRVRYSFGGEAVYLKRGSITRQDGQATIDPLRSRTNLLTYQLGVTFIF